MAQTVTRLLVHVVFSTKNRENTIVPEVIDEFHRYIGGICRAHDSPLLAAGGTSNHIHLLMSLSKNIALSRLVMDIKKDSSLWLKTKGPALAGFHWQECYGAFSIGESQLAVARQYIARQATKHRTTTFEDEFVAFLAKYNVSYDPQYIWA